MFVADGRSDELVGSHSRFFCDGNVHVGAAYAYEQPHTAKPGGGTPSSG